MKKYAYIGALGFLSVITTEFGIIGILPMIAKHYEVTIGKAGILLSAFALVIALTGPFMTLLLSGYDKKKVMLTSIFLFLITGVVSATAPPFWILILVRLLPAFLQPVYIATALSLAVTGANSSDKNKLMSIVFSGVAIAMVTTVPLVSYVASVCNWQISFVAQALVSFIALCFICFGLPNTPVREKKSFGSQLKILRQPTFLVSTAMNFFMIAAWFSIYSYFAEYFITEKKIKESSVSYLLFLFGIVGVLANFIAGKLLNKSVTFATLLFLSGTIIIPIALLYSDKSLTTVAIITALWGFLYAPSFLNASTYMISSAPTAMEFANSLATSFGNMGVSVGTFLSGIIISSFGIQYIPWLTICFGTLSISMIALRKIMEKRQRSK